MRVCKVRERKTSVCDSRHLFFGGVNEQTSDEIGQGARSAGLRVCKVRERKTSVCGSRHLFFGGGNRKRGLHKFGREYRDDRGQKCRDRGVPGGPYHRQALCAGRLQGRADHVHQTGGVQTGDAGQICNKGASGSDVRDGQTSGSDCGCGRLRLRGGLGYIAEGERQGGGTLYFAFGRYRRSPQSGGHHPHGESGGCARRYHSEEPGGGSDGYGGKSLRRGAELHAGGKGDESGPDHRGTEKGGPLVRVRGYGRHAHV